MKNAPLFIAFAEKIKRLIKAGELPVGSYFPSIRKLQNEYGFSRNTIASSIRILRNEGFLEKENSSRLGFKVIRTPDDNLKKATELHNVVKLILPFSFWQYTGNRLLEEIESIFSKNHTSLLFSNNENAMTKERQLLERCYSMDDNLITALILMTGSSFNNPSIKLLQKISSKIPIILLDRYIWGLTAHLVGVNNRNIGFEATQYLLRNGHKKIGFVSGFSRVSTGYERFVGYKMALQHAGIDPLDDWIIMKKSLFESYETTLNSGEIIGKEILSNQNRPTAVVCESDKSAVGLINFFIDRGFSIPADIAIIGCDDDPHLRIKSPISVCTFRYPFEEIANELFVLYTKLCEKPTTTPKSIELLAEFIEGESC